MLDLAPHKRYNNQCLLINNNLCLQSEVTEINKQKFLAELGKLLTFMYDEDRQSALNMYSDMFDMAADEQLLLQFLVSPMRQAVIIARAYNAKERKLQVNTESRDADYYEDDGTPDYVLAISALEDEALERKIISPKVPEEQFSLFADGVHPMEAEPEMQDAVAPEEPATVSAPAQMAEAEVIMLDDEDEPEYADAVTVADDSTEWAAVMPEDATFDDTDEVSVFLTEFSIAGDELASAEEVAEVVPEQPEKDTAPHSKVKEKAVNEQRQRPAKQEVQTVDLVERKANIPLLALYVIIAVPVVAVCVFALLIPTLFFLLMAVGAVVLGCMALSSAFGAFTMFADVMVVLGAALAILAIGLLCLWLFVWFVGGAIAGLINAIIKLGGKWCYKEVPAV